ncbi:MAG: 2Fe-2S iron-sulfur cluster binding domain-containing protein [Erysipelotrichaceae bacterium]|jgi:carbon-monoxide dehydrogenase small subunit|nr:2Fe-2S iron-sulfur cluster-binding protein [Bacilli bacterium]NLV29215.1 2Fe-2S iron-sulfur cluster binding domain-containing protein [Erysipelotrichaceae bacterium]HPY80028.1 2Fe-2S iron-sulfur cluster-binding protein [Bacilli bacterium]HQA56118.1 2Fe-2S iron-sulfur cluster-binding protein [Bacilli bacterium]
MEVKFVLNHMDIVVNARPDEYLAETLRNLGILSVRVGCNESNCGTCTVLINDKPAMSCSVLTAQVEGKKVTTVEDIQEEANKIADYFSDEGADQCGFCLVGFALVVHALTKEYKDPTDEEIRNYLVGNLCRCSGYHAQFLAVKKYLAEVKKHA